MIPKFRDFLTNHPWILRNYTAAQHDIFNGNWDDVHLLQAMEYCKPFHQYLQQYLQKLQAPQQSSPPTVPWYDQIHAQHRSTAISVTHAQSSENDTNSTDLSSSSEQQIDFPNKLNDNHEHDTSSSEMSLSIEKNK